MEETINTAPVADEIASTPAAEPSVEAIQAAATKLDEAPVPADSIIYDEFLDFPDEDADELSSREFGERFIKAFNDEQLLITSLGISFARAIKAVAANQKAGAPGAFINLVADLAVEHTEDELKEAAEVCLAEMQARQGAEKVEG